MESAIQRATRARTAAWLAQSQTAPDSVQQHAYAMIDMIAQFSPAVRVLRDHGTWYYRPGTAVPPTDYVQQQPRECFANAFRFDVNTVYAGYYSTQDLQFAFFTDHAWNMRDDGVVIDTTLPHGTAAWYFGLKVPRALVMQLAGHAAQSPGGLNYLDAIRFQEAAQRERSLDALRAANPLNRQP